MRYVPIVPPPSPPSTSRIVPHTGAQLHLTKWLSSDLTDFLNSWELLKNVSIDLWERGREKHRFVVAIIDALIGWFLYVPWPGIEPGTLVYGDNTPTSWATCTGPSLIPLTFINWGSSIRVVPSHSLTCLIIYLQSMNLWIFTLFYRL